MELTVCGARRGPLVIADACLIEVEKPPGSTMNLTKAAALIFGGALGAVMLADEEDTGLGVGGSVLNLERGEAVPETVEQIERVTTCWAGEVPEQLAREWNWPRRLDEETRLTFFPRSLIRSVRLPRTGALYAVVDGSKDVDVGISFWHVGKARRHLQRAGYALHY